MAAHPAFKKNLGIDAIAIKGERKSEVKTSENGVTRSEFRYVSFHRVIPLPAQIQNDKVEAEFNNGIFSLNLPKAEEEKNRSRSGKFPRAAPLLAVR